MLASLVEAAEGHPVAVAVLANGCTDTTADEVRACAWMFADLSLVEIDLPDKAYAWNVYVREFLSEARADEVAVHFFVDGDVRLGPRALHLLQATLDDAPGARAAGGMPTSGRDMEAWRARMMANVVLAGGLYALRGSFIQQLRDYGTWACPLASSARTGWLPFWPPACRAARRRQHRPGGRVQTQARLLLRSLSPGRLATTRNSSPRTALCAACASIRDAGEPSLERRARSHAGPRQRPVPRCSSAWAKAVGRAGHAVPSPCSAVDSALPVTSCGQVTNR